MSPTPRIVAQARRRPGRLRRRRGERLPSKPLPPEGPLLALPHRDRALRRSGPRPPQNRLPLPPPIGLAPPLSGSLRLQGRLQLPPPGRSALSPGRPLPPPSRLPLASPRKSPLPPGRLLAPGPSLPLAVPREPLLRVARKVPPARKRALRPRRPADTARSPVVAPDPALRRSSPKRCPAAASAWRAALERLRVAGLRRGV
jgi:hypothetical protein